jgi:hypothetical protein
MVPKTIHVLKRQKHELRGLGGWKCLLGRTCKRLFGFRLFGSRRSCPTFPFRPNMEVGLHEARWLGNIRYECVSKPGRHCFAEMTLAISPLSTCGVVQWQCA